jgi:hypothetical protein
MDKIIIQHIAKKYNFTYHEALSYYRKNCMINKDYKDWKKIAQAIIK